MIVAIMQPYFFPYIGYFQLMRAVDQFVFYDDVQYITRGWVNRNQIIEGGAPKWLTLPVLRANRELAIKDRHYLLDDNAISAVQQRIKYAYAKAPAFREAYPVIEEALSCRDSTVSVFNAHLLEVIANWLGLGCSFKQSSTIYKDTSLHGEAKILDICSRLQANQYINAIGGTDLYNGESFSERGIDLSFVRTTIAPEVLASGSQFLSIIHELMWLGLTGVRERLDQYTLVKG